MAEVAKEYWPLEGFLDALILELDRAQDTLAVKGLTRKLTYAVKDLALDLQIFPDYRDGDLRFANARPGEEGASRISFQLGSITDRQIRDSANQPATRDDVTIAEIEDLDPRIKQSLQKVGVTKASDLERIERQDVDLEKVIDGKTGGSAKVDYANLANLINKTKRNTRGPSVFGLSARPDRDGIALHLSGRDLAIREGMIPAARLNGEAIEVTEAAPDRLTLQARAGLLRHGDNRLLVALDPHAVIRLSIEG
jgi:hypothetical protein